jgi:aminoglycoside phosphotransferase family enzyme
LLTRRAAEGHVRRCHGDLHLGNIVLWEGEPTPFDAIEFDEKLAVIDTLYDLAFLLMDLDERGHRAAANVVLNRYLWRRDVAGDLEGLAALPLFLSLRAGIRAMVAAQKAALEDAGTAPADAAAARRYFEASLGYPSPPPPRLIAVGGLSGTGKSTLAAALP